MENSLLEYSCINIILDNRRQDDYDRLLAEFEIQGISNYRFWDAITDKKTVIECINASHKMIVRDAKDRCLPYVVIMEQDCTFPAMDGWKYFIKNIPEQFDIFSAATYVDDLEDKNILCGFHLYIVNSCFYDTFLSVINTGHIDTEVDNLKADFKVCRPFAALQRKGWSFNHSMIVDYNIVVNPKDIYL